jgi:hypothetical protein
MTLALALPPALPLALPLSLALTPSRARVCRWSGFRKFWRALALRRVARLRI